MPDDIIDYSEIRVKVKRKYFCKLYDRKDFLDQEEYFTTQKALKDVESALNQLLHFRSVLEKIKLRSGYSPHE